MRIVYLSLGSNKGDRVGYIQQATKMLNETAGIELVRTSAFYETEPWEADTNGWFVNAVIEIKCEHDSKELLNICNSIEAQLGRNRSVEGFYGDRTIDIDILFFGDEVINNEDLVIPHKHFHERAFTLVPMLELAPNFVHPELKKTVSELHDALENPEMVYLYGTRV